MAVILCPQFLHQLATFPASLTLTSFPIKVFLVLSVWSVTFSGAEYGLDQMTARMRSLCWTRGGQIGRKDFSWCMNCRIRKEYTSSVGEASAWFSRTKGSPSVLREADGPTYLVEGESSEIESHTKRSLRKCGHRGILISYVGIGRIIIQE